MRHERPARVSRLPRHALRSGPEPRPGRRRARLSLLPAITLLLAALGLFVAAPAQAQTTVWSATLTADQSGTAYGCDNSDANQDNCSAALTDDNFTYGGQTYTITRLYWGSTLNELFLRIGSLSGSQMKSTFASLAMIVDRTPLAISDAGTQSSGLAFSYTPPTDWTDGRRVSLSLQTRPAAPTGLTLTHLSASDARLLFAWTAPTGTVTGYDVEYKVSSASTWTDDGHIGISTSRTITGLTHNTEYDVRVRAVSAGVPGAWAEAQATAKRTTVSFAGFIQSVFEIESHGMRGVEQLIVEVDPPLHPSGSSVHVRIQGRSDATQGDDYTLSLPNVPGSTTTKELWLPPGQRFVRFGISTVKDFLTEGEEILYLRLAAITDAPYRCCGDNPELEVPIGDSSVPIPATADPRRGITIEPRRVAVAQDSTASYSIRLNSAPGEDVTVKAYFDGDGGPKNLGFAGSELTVSPASLTFTPSNWQTPQSFTVTPAADSVGKHVIVHSLRSDDRDYNSDHSFQGPGIRTHIVVEVTDGSVMGSQLGAVTYRDGQVPPQPTNSGSLITRIREYRNDPLLSSNKAHTNRWDRALLALGETVADTSLTPMTAAEAQGYVDQGWTRWVDVAAALKAKELRDTGGLNPDPNQLGQPLEEVRLTPPALHADLTTSIYQYRNDPQWETHQPHVHRWDRVLLSLGEPVSNTSLTPMGDAEAQGYADQGWTRWVDVAATLKTVVTGTSAAETLTGTDSGELLVGLGGDDTLNGQGGYDELRGGGGDDDLSGGGDADRFVFFASQTGANAISDFASGDVIVLLGSGWSSVSDIIASVQAIGSANYRYTLAPGLTVETTNNRPLRTEDFVTD